MAFEHNDSGSIWPNQYKKADNHPDMKGTEVWKGEVIEVAAWRRTAKDGTEYIYFSLQEPRELNQQPQSTEINDEIPF